MKIIYFSVVIPLYNKEESIKNTLNSVLEQIYPYYELIIVNDGSTDKSLEVAESFQDNRIRIINKKNGGVSSARNEGIKAAEYQWIAFLDADDLWLNNHLQEAKKMINLFPQKKVFATSFKKTGNIVMFRHKRKDRISVIKDYFKEAFHENLICSSAVIIHRTAFSIIGGFNTQLSHGEDLDMWTRLARRYPVVKSKLITSIYRLEAENRSKKSGRIENSLAYYYNFSSSTSTSETKYYKRFIILKMYNTLKGGNKTLFNILKTKHNNDIGYIDLIKYILINYLNKILSYFNIRSKVFGK